MEKSRRAIGFRLGDLRSGISRPIRWMRTSSIPSAGMARCCDSIGSRARWRRCIVPDENTRLSGDAPLQFSPIDPHTLYLGAQRLLKTSDAGVTWQFASPDLTIKAAEKDAGADKDKSEKDKTERKTATRQGVHKARLPPLQFQRLRLERCGREPLTTSFKFRATPGHELARRHAEGPPAEDFRVGHRRVA